MWHLYCHTSDSEAVCCKEACEGLEASKPGLSLPSPTTLEFINLFALASIFLNCKESHVLKEREGMLAKIYSTFFNIQ